MPLAMVRSLYRPRSRTGATLDPMTLLCLAYGLREPTREFRFDPVRRWRLDFAWEPELVALEVEGGIWTGGRHTRGAGFLADIEKYNAATLAGWSVFRATPQQIAGGDIGPLLQQVLR